MRALLVVLLLAVPSLAAAAPQLRCEYNGNKTKVTIVNTDGKDGQWHIADGTYEVAVGKSAEELVLKAAVSIGDRQFGP